MRGKVSRNLVTYIFILGFVSRLKMTESEVDERTKRKSMFSLKRASENFVHTHEIAIKSSSDADRFNANVLREQLLLEVDQMRNQFPEPRQESDVVELLQSTAKILEERPIFNSLPGEENGSNSPPATPVSIAVSDGNETALPSASQSSVLNGVTQSGAGQGAADKTHEASVDVSQLVNALDGAILSYKIAVDDESQDEQQIAEMKKNLIDCATALETAVSDTTRDRRVSEILKSAHDLVKPTAENRVIDLERQLKAAQGSVKELEGQVQTCRGQIRECEEQVQTLQGQRSEFESQVRELEGKLFDAQQDNIDLREDNRVKALKFGTEYRLRTQYEKRLSEQLLEFEQKEQVYVDKIKALETARSSSSLPFSAASTTVTNTVSSSLLRPSYMSAQSHANPSVGMSASAPAFTPIFPSAAAPTATPTAFASLPAIPLTAVPTSSHSSILSPAGVSQMHVPVSQPSFISDPATQSLIQIQTESHAYNMLVQKRPKHKYTGDNRHIDFDSFLHQCESLMNIPGASSGMKLAELPFWFGGTAGLVVDRFLGEVDTAKALADVFRALKSEFGRKRLTARQMLVETLQGEKLQERHYSQIKTFILNLEKIYKVAVETARQDSFDLPETINDIIRSKLPHLASKWAKKLSDLEIDNDDEESVNPSFSQFIKFAKKQNSISENMGEILKSQEPSKFTQQRPPLRLAAAHTGAATQGPTASQSAETCVFCPGSTHGASDCRKFSAYTMDQKAAAVRDKRLCTSCLGRTSANHRPWNCATKIGCNTCGEKHHSLLHGIPYRMLRSDQSQAHAASNL